LVRVNVNRPAQQALQPEQIGALKFRREPSLGRAWGGPMNGQRWRCLLFAELVHKVAPKAIIETGTYLGTTTEWLAAFQLPVFTCEADPENYGFAKARLQATPNVTVVKADSRAFLMQLLRGPIGGGPNLVYLDAHWNDDLPLAEELEIIFTRSPDSVVMIDDFEVPGDPGYGFDDYGAGKALTAEYISGSADRFNLHAHYPTTPSSCETGALRGCVVLAQTTLSAVSLLRPA
jgi:predicted O-methyltransferase YrrM